MTPLQYAIAACDTMMRRYAAADLPPKGHFHYHQGVFLSGMNETYRLCGNEAYIDYIKAWIDAVFDAEGRIRDYVHGDLDSFPYTTARGIRTTSSASRRSRPRCATSRKTPRAASGTRPI